MKYPEDVRYLVVDFAYGTPNTESEILYDSNGVRVAGYVKGGDEAELFTCHQLDKHELAPKGQAMVLDLLTGHILNWKPLDESQIDGFIDEMYDASDVEEFFNDD